MKTGLLTVCLLVSIAGAAANAQTIRASIYGRVIDASQAPVPNATVRAIHVATNSETVYVADQAASMTSRGLYISANTAWKWRQANSENSCGTGSCS